MNTTNIPNRPEAEKFQTIKHGWRLVVLGLLGGLASTATLHAAPGDLDVLFSSSSDVGVSATSYSATGKAVNLQLAYAPSLGNPLTVVENTELPFIQGQFSNLVHGDTVDLNFGGITYEFVANYYGGTGNDLVLVWKNTTVSAWGANSEGQLGDGTTTDRYSAVLVNQEGALSGKTVFSVAAGDSHSVALCADGSLVAWGSNDYGQLGDGSTANQSLPVLVNLGGILTGKTVIFVTAGNFFTIALCSDGTLAAWGYNNRGQLGDGTTTNRLTPVLVNQSGALSGKTVVSIAAGNSHTTALCADGTLAAWGYNSYGQLGDGTTTQRNTPVLVDQSGILFSKSVGSLAVGGDDVIALCSDGTLAAWGGNYDGQLGDGTTTSRVIPVLVYSSGILSNKTVTSVSAGLYFAVALCSDGTLATWGGNYSGQLGDGTTTRRTIPVLVNQGGVLAGKTVVSMTAASAYAMALCADGTPVSWGGSWAGQLGDGTNSQRNTPVLVDRSGILSGKPIISLKGGYAHSLAVVASAEPEIVVEQPISTELIDGTANVDFGSVLTGSSSSLEFTIRNQAPGDLIGLGITLDGTNPDDFVVTANPTAPVIAGDSTTFTVTFTPNSLGTRYAQLHIASNDADENPFDVDLTGTALATINPDLVGNNGDSWDLTTSGGLRISDASYATGGFSQGDAFDDASIIEVDGVRYTGTAISNNGTRVEGQSQTLAGVDVTVSIGLLPNRPALRTIITLENQSGGELTPNLAWLSNWGSDSDTIIHASSSGDLSYDTTDYYGVTNDSTNPNVDSGDPTNVSYWGDGTALMPNAVTGTVFSNSRTEGLGVFYNLTLAVGERIRLVFGHELSTSGSAGIAAASTGIPSGDFLAGLSAVELAEIENWGGSQEILLIEDQGGFGTTADLLTSYGYGVTVVNNEYANSYADLLDGGYLGGFDLVIYGERGAGSGSLLPDTVGASLETYIQSGGHLLVTGYDTLGDPTDTVLAALVRATSPGDEPSLSTTWNVSSIDHPILNGAFGDLRGLVFTGTNYDDDSLTADTAAGAVELVAAGDPRAGGRLIFTDLPGAAGSVGYWNGGMDGISSNAQPDFSSGGNQQSIFLNYVSFTAGSDNGRPEIAVEQPVGISLADGAATIGFGAISTGSTGNLVFTVNNSGSGDLTGLGITIDGANSGDFSVTTNPTAPVIQDGNTTFTVEFAPSSLGTRTAELHIASNDADENPFDITLTGAGINNQADFDFKILSLGTTGSTVVDHNSLTSDDRGGIAVSDSRVFVTGDNATSSHALADLNGGVSLGRRVDGVCSDLGTGKVYSLAIDGAEFISGGTSINQLIELDPATGALTANVINLSSTISVVSGSSGVFSGKGRVAIHNGAEAYDILVPSGIVSNLGTTAFTNRYSSENWAIWGVAEYFSGNLHLAYRSSLGQQIDRTRVPDGLTETIATFTDLSDLASWTVSPSTGRWYFHHEFDSQFGGTSETLGFADATFLTATAPLTFPDPNLEAAIRTVLGIPSGPVTEADMETLIAPLNLRNVDITDLSGLQFATHLRILDIRSNTFTDATATWAILDELPLYRLYTDLPRPGGDSPGLLTEAVTDTFGGTFYIVVDSLNLPILDITGLDIDTSEQSNLDALKVFADAGVAVVDTGSNLPPAARATYTVVNLISGQVELDGSGSNDLDGGIVNYAWTWNGGSANGTTATSTVLLPQGQTAVTLTVTDNNGGSGSTQITVVVPLPGPGELDSLDAAISGGANPISAIAIQPDGKIIIGGDFTSVLGVPRNNIARLNADGTLDLGFDPNADSWVESVTVQADGKILIGGWFNTLQPNGAATATTRNYLARLHEDGTLDTSFDPNPDGWVHCVALQADGQILVGGAFSELSPAPLGNSVSRAFAARLHPDGTVDTSFDPKPDEDVFAMVEQPDGDILIVGGFWAFVPWEGFTVPRKHIARVDSSGNLDMSFDPYPEFGAINCVILQPDGKILIGGYFETLQPNGAANPTTRNRIARLNADGTLDAGFDPNANNEVQSMALQADGKILIGGPFTALQPNGAATPTTRNRIARLNADGSLDPDFDPDANGSVRSIAIQADGKILLMGAFTALQPNGAANPTPRNLFARLLNDPATQALSAPDATQVNWTRGGSAPEVSHVIFENSNDEGVTWNPLGTAIRIGTSSDWQLTGLALPENGQLRARGRTLTGGGFGDGTGVVEALAGYSGLLPNVQFADANLESAIRAALGIFNGPITVADMETLTTPLDLKNLGITDLSGLEFATNLRILNVRGNPFSDATATWAILDGLGLYCLYTDLPRPGGNGGFTSESFTDTNQDQFYAYIDTPNLPTWDITGLNIDTSNQANLDALQTFADLGVLVVSPGNLPPTARATASQLTGQISTFRFNGSGSYDSDGTVQSWLWEWNDNGPQSTSGPVVDITLPTGSTTVILTVTDNDANARSTTIQISNLDADFDGVSTAWELTNGFDSELAGDINTLDSDGDGDSDLLEIFQGTDRMSRDEHHGVTLEAANQAGQTLTVRYRRSTSQSAVAGAPQWSAELSNMIETGATTGGITAVISESVVATGTDYEIVEAVVSVTSGTTGRLFFVIQLSPND